MARTADLVVRLAFLCMLLSQCLGQGLDSNNLRASLGAANVYTKSISTYQGAARFVKQYAKSGVCSNNRGSLCASQGATKELRAQLMIATSPPAYDARNRAHNGGFSAVGPVKDQADCNTCVSFVVLAAAQSAMACALERDATSKLSEKDFFFCKSPPQGEERTCDSAWNMFDGIQAWISLTNAKKYPVTEACMGYYPEQPCVPTCTNTDPDLSKGSFNYQRLSDFWMIQDWIRTHGAVVTRLNVYSDFKKFFQNNPNGVYKGPGPGAKFEQNHAVLLVGYDMTADPPYWIIKNSWGAVWAYGGYCKVAFNAGEVGVGTDGDTYGLKFNLYNDDGASSAWDRVKPSTRRPGCYEYKATSSDYVWKVANTVGSVFGLSAQKLLLDNKGVIKSPDMWLGGVTLMLCGAGRAP